MNRLLCIARFRLGKTPNQIDRCLRELVQDAYDNVRSVQDRFRQAGVTPGSVRSSHDLVRLPIANRATYDLDRFKEYLREGTNPSRSFRTVTSGTTGQQFTVYMSHSEALYRRLLLFRSFRNHARIPVNFSIVDVGTGVRFDREVRKFGFGRVTRISRLLPLDAQVEIALHARPDIITGRPSCLELLAERILSQQITIRPRVVLCKGETLHPSAQALMTDAFGCRVADFYSCEEVGNVAWECLHHSGLLHVQTDACILEVVDAAGVPVTPGIVGQIVITNLFNRTMPFIRHELGDRGTLAAPQDKPCSCGYLGPSLLSLDGRDDDFFWQLDGQRISPRAIVMTLRNPILQLEEQTGHRVSRYRIIQEAAGRILVQLSTPAPIPSDVVTRIVSELKQVKLGPEFLVERVDKIPSDPSGKYRRIISHMRARPNRNLE